MNSVALASIRLPSGLACLEDMVFGCLQVSMYLFIKEINTGHAYPQSIGLYVATRIISPKLTVPAIQ